MEKLNIGLASVKEVIGGLSQGWIYIRVRQATA